MSLAEIWYNSNYHSSLSRSPYKALYGCEANLGLAPTVTPDTPSSVAKVVEHREEHLQSLKAHLARAQNRMNLMADSKRTDHQFEVGEQVLLKLQPYTQSSVAHHPYPKLAYKYYGPYTVLESIGAVAYRLELPAGSLIHPVFHVSQLKPFTANYTPIYADLPVTTDLDAAETFP